MKAADNDARNVSTALSQLMPNVGGSFEARRKLLASLVHSVLLYGSLSWVKTIQYTPSHAAETNKAQHAILAR